MEQRELRGTTIERFDADDGDFWFSLVKGGDVVTGVMHEDLEHAHQELLALLHDCD